MRKRRGQLVHVENATDNFIGWARYSQLTIPKTNNHAVTVADAMESSLMLFTLLKVMLRGKVDAPRSDTHKVEEVDPHEAVAQ
jgi:hypothetical protein